MMTSATAAFLGTPELLEALFLQCDMRSLLTSVQRVCRQWREIAASSPAVQAHLYFRPAIPNRSSDSSNSNSATSNNPLLAEVFPPFFEPFAINTSEGFWGRAEIRALPLARRPAAFMREDASWRAMHVRQPPPRALGVVMPTENYSVVYERRPGEAVVRMGELYDHVIRALTMPGQRWRILWRGSGAGVGEGAGLGPALLLESHTTLLQEFNAACTKELLREVDIVLVRTSDPLRSVAILPSDRDFMAQFTHPARQLDFTPPTRVRGKMSRREQREL
ncbi:hypothetical protein SLS62_009557 [Diatrype stigma]|uniref:F-box domain-containing protein n=1 Tax=Diatrype stigma TaxID=117547 RepID=A0AAN9UG26_9PEZI